jgi:hypothetical protein
MRDALWQRFKARHKRILGEVRQIQSEMAQKNPRPALTIFPNRANSMSAVIFWVFLILVAGLCWFVIRRAGGHPY